MGIVENKAKAWRHINRLVRRNPFYSNRQQALLEEARSWSLTERQTWLTARLQGILRRAAQTHYGKEVGGGDDLASWPVLDKERVRARPRDLVIGSPRFAIPASTSGSSGQPLRLYRSFQAVSFEQAVLDDVLRHNGIEDPVNARIAVLRGDYVKDPSDHNPPYWKQVSPTRIVLSSYHLSGENLPHYLRKLESFQPDVLMAYPSVLENLLLLLAAAGRACSLRLVVTSSEVLSTTTWNKARSLLNCNLIDRYGQAERVAVAHARMPERYDFTFPYGAIELVMHSSDDQYDYYELLATSLWNDTMPLVRYRTGDLVKVRRGTTVEDLRQICLGVTQFAGIAGRQGDYLISPEGVRLIAMNHLPRDIPGLVQMQIIQESLHGVAIQVIATSEFNESSRAALLKAAHAKIPSSMRVDIQRVASLERNASGKVPYIIRRVSA